MGIKARVSTAVGVLSVSLFGWWVSDIPIGYYGFKEMCKKEGGVEIKGEINPYVGWFVKNEAQARYVTSAFSAPYARFLSKDSKWVDVRYKGGNSGFSESYFIGPADEKEKPGYQFEIKNEAVPDAIRLRSRILIVKEISSEKDVLSSRNFIFSWMDSRRTIMGMSSVDTCFDGDDESARIKRSPEDQVNIRAAPSANVTVPAPAFGLQGLSAYFLVPT